MAFGPADVRNQIGARWNLIGRRTAAYHATQ